MSKVYTIGEALIDFIPSITESELKDVPSFKRVMGGAPANVAVAIAKLGGSSSFISKLGKDAFGDHITEQLEEHGVATDWLRKTDEANTGLAFVSLKKDGQRDFSFYRKPSADMLLTEKDVQQIQLIEGDIVHFCSVDLIDAPVKTAHKNLIERAIKEKAFISFDPNVRLPLWESEEACRKAIHEFIPYAHLLKISDEELSFITGIADEEEALNSLFVGNVEWIIYTLGKAGARLVSKRGEVIEHSGFEVEAIDTTGAGDAFIGATLFQLQQKKFTPNDLVNINETNLTELLKFSNAYAALTTMRNGAVEALPTLTETEKYLMDKS